MLTEIVQCLFPDTGMTEIARRMISYCYLQLCLWCLVASYRQCQYLLWQQTEAPLIIQVNNMPTAEEDDLNCNDVATGNFDDGLDELGDHKINGDINPLKECDKIRSETTVSSVQKMFQRQDILFTSTYETLKHKMCVVFETDTIERFLKEMGEKAYIRNMKDHLGRTFLHIAVRTKY